MNRHTTLPLIALVVLLPLASGAGGEQEAESGFFPFLRERMHRHQGTPDRKVLAFYYTWYGRPENHGRWVHWERVDAEKHDIANSTHYPEAGAYDSHDSDMIDTHIDQARTAGIDGFICTWWGRDRFDDRAFAKVLDRAVEKEFEATVYWETAPGSGRAQTGGAVDDLVYILEKYGSHPAFFRHEDKPVIFIYGRVMNQLSTGQWKEIISRTAEKSGRDFVLIADGYTERNACLFDGIHTYNICSWVAPCAAEELGAVSDEAFGRAAALARARGKIACLTIIPGYDDRKIREPGINAARASGGTYRTLWNAALRADPDWILITSWNEWHEGSEIEPSREHGDRYLAITKEFAPRFKRMPRKEAAKKTAAAMSPPSKELAALYERRTVAVLPDFESDAIFWLVDQPIAIRELTWEEVVDPKAFNAAACPVTVYGGHESYTQSVGAGGDVDDALVGYLKEGGLIMALGDGPLPFYYNARREAVRSAGRFGFPLLGSGGGGRNGPGGWERPPADSILRFTIDTDLVGIAHTALPFPRSGDLRWRPATHALLDERDVYLPLARLHSESGEWLGDGIVYVEHKVSEPVGGKNIYAWMGLLRGEKKEKILEALFLLAGRKQFGR